MIPKSHRYTMLWCNDNHNTCFRLLLFSGTNISQGSVETCLRCGGIFYYCFAKNILLSLSLKEVWQDLSSSWDGRPFGHNRHGPKRGGLLCHFTGGGGWAPSNTIWSAPRSTSVPSGILTHPTVWPQQTWAKNWGLCPFGWGVGSPSNTMWPEPRPTSLPSFILIHPTIWPQYTNITDRTDR